MKVSERIDILKQYDPSEDVVIASNPYPAFTAWAGWRPDHHFHFVVKEHGGQLGAKGSSTIIVLEMIEVGYFKPFAKLKG
jgi:hypothetical protein